MSNDRDLLVQACLAAPDDDPARLVYADWLEEYGRGGEVDLSRLIRLQVESAALAHDHGEAVRRGAQAPPPCPRCTRQDELHEEIAPLLARLDPPLGPGRPSPGLWERGFCVEWTCQPWEWHRQGAEWAAMRPLLRRVALLGCCPEARTMEGGLVGWFWAFDDRAAACRVPSPFNHPSLWETPAPQGRRTFRDDYRRDRPPDPPPRPVRWYASRDDADRALTAVLLLWARREAALPF